MPAIPRELPDSECAEFDPWEPEAPSGPLCEKEGIEYDTYGGEQEWRCGRAGSVTTPSGRLRCEDHAGEIGYGPKQEEYGYDPADGNLGAALLSADEVPAAEATRP